jgi:hypothetical protein
VGRKKIGRFGRNPVEVSPSNSRGDSLFFMHICYKRSKEAQEKTLLCIGSLINVTRTLDFASNIEEKIKGNLFWKKVIADVAAVKYEVE